METLTVKGRDTMNENIIEELLHAQKADMPSEFKSNPIISRGDGDLPVPIVVNKLDDSNYYYVWDTRTFERVPVLGYMLSKVLNRTRPDGSRRFTTADPRKQPVHGNIKCMLHPDSSDREHYNSLGFRICMKSNITNNFQLKEHMRKKHKQEWSAIQAEIADRERQEDRDAQKVLYESLARTVKAPEIKLVEVEEEDINDEDITKELSPTEYVCTRCNRIHRETSNLGHRHLKYRRE